MRIDRFAPWLASVALVASLGCAKEEPAPPPKAAPEPEIVLVSRVEQANLKEDVLAQLAADRARECRRPVLRGEATSGPADKDILAAITPQSEAVDECQRAVEELNDVLRRWLADSSAKPIAPVQAVIDVCTPLEPLVARAVAHADACSPYLVGRRGAPNLVPVVRVGSGLAAHTLQLARRGEADRAVSLAVDWLRLLQDLARGEGTPLVVAMVAVGAARPMVNALRSLLAGAAPIPPATLARLDAELAALLATEPRFGETLPAERVWPAVTGLLKAVEGARWKEPEGWPPGHEDTGYGHASGGKHIEGISPEQEQALVWVALDANLRELEAACPPTADLASCRDGLQALARRRAAETEASGLERFLRVAAAEDAPQAIRTEIEGILKSVGTPDFARYVGRQGLHRAHLVMLRLHAAIRRAEATGEGCPTPDALASPKWAPYLAVPGTRTSLAVTAPEPGVLRLEPADWLLATGEKERDVWTVRCGE